MPEGSKEFLALTGDIKKHGLRESIWLHQDGSILDGRNRLRACAKAGVKPHFKTFLDLNAKAFVISMNLHRRHLNESQRAMIAEKIAPMSKGRPTVNAGIPAFSQTEAAEALNVGRESVQFARKVRRDGVPELAAAVENGEVAVSYAAVIAQRPEAEQRRIIQSGLTQPVIGAALRRQHELNAKRENPVVNERRKSHLEGVIDAANYAERRSMVEHWIDHLATDLDKQWLLDKVADMQAEKYGFADRDGEALDSIKRNANEAHN
jgi:hypothetical protein